MSSNNLDRYEYLTGEDLGLKPSTVKQARFEYSPLSKFFNKGLKEEERKEGPLKILKNIEGKNEQQLKAIEDQGNKQLNTIKNISTGSKLLKPISFFRGLSPEAKQLMNEIKEDEKDIDPEKLVCIKSDGKIFNFNIFKLSFKFKITLEEAKKDQYKMLKQLTDLEKYDPENPDKINSRKETLINPEKLYNNRNNVIKAFENGVFPFKDGFRKKESDWVKVDEERFNKIKNEIQKAKNKNLQARPNRVSPIYFDESYKLIQGIEHSKSTHEEALKIITNIRNNIKRLDHLYEFNPNQAKVLNAIFIRGEIFTGEFKWYKLSDNGCTLLRSKSDKKE